MTHELIAYREYCDERSCNKRPTFEVYESENLLDALGKYCKPHAKLVRDHANYQAALRLARMMEVSDLGDLLLASCQGSLDDARPTRP